MYIYIYIYMSTSDRVSATLQLLAIESLPYGMHIQTLPRWLDENQEFGQKLTMFS